MTTPCLHSRSYSHSRWPILRFCKSTASKWPFAPRPELAVPGSASLTSRTCLSRSRGSQPTLPCTWPWACRAWGCCQDHSPTCHLWQKQTRKEKDSDIPDVALAPYKGISYGGFLKLKKREGQEVVLRGNFKQIIGSAMLKAGEQQLASLFEGLGS